MTIDAEFEIIDDNPKFLCRDGVASGSGATYSHRKLCFSCTDRDLLARHLYQLSKRPDCFFVKFATSAKGGMYLGRCFLTTEAAVGDVWARYKKHPSMHCTVQDDEFIRRFRKLSHAYDNLWNGSEDINAEVEQAAMSAQYEP